jgi:hypothetical protein
MFVQNLFFVLLQTLVQFGGNCSLPLPPPLHHRNRIRTYQLSKFAQLNTPQQLLTFVFETCHCNNDVKQGTTQKQSKTIATTRRRRRREGRTPTKCQRARRLVADWPPSPLRRCAVRRTVTQRHNGTHNNVDLSLHRLHNETGSNRC